MIIHKNHPLSKLVIKHTHESNFHCGREQTLSILRNKYWIPNVRGFIRKIITDCYIVEKYQSHQAHLSWQIFPKKDCSITINHLQILVLIILDHFTSNYQKPQDQTLQKGRDTGSSSPV